MTSLAPQFSSSKNHSPKERGQVLIIVVFAIVGLIAFIGLVVDLGLVYIGHGQLRRSVDAAALAASLQYRKGYRLIDLQRSATEFLTLNGINDPNVTIVTCDEDAALCDKNGDGTVSENEHRKLVQVIASSTVHLAFLPVIGWNEVPLKAEAVSEAASVDVVIAIDRSESMTGDADKTDPMYDPSQCNNNPPPYNGGGGFSGSCDPFTDVKRAADSFVDQLFFPYDRVAIITFDRHVHCKSSPACLTEDRLSLALTSEENQIHNHLRNLWVYQTGDDSTPDSDVGWDGPHICNRWPGYTTDPATRFADGAGPGPCRWYNDTSQQYIGFDCPTAYANNDFSSCTSTNIAGALMAAGDEFAASMRQEALWVVILLTDGAANSSTDASGNLPFGFCPQGTKRNQPYCRDNEPFTLLPDGITKVYDNTRHCIDPDPALHITVAMNLMCLGVTDPTWDFAGTRDDGSSYDADDSARDMADWLSQNNVLIFSIGLGRLVTNQSFGDPRDGEELMKYAAGVGGGLYFPAPDSSELRQIFARIADNIATRLTR